MQVTDEHALRWLCSLICAERGPVHRCLQLKLYVILSLPLIQACCSFAHLPTTGQSSFQQLRLFHQACQSQQSHQLPPSPPVSGSSWWCSGQMPLDCETLPVESQRQGLSNKTITYHLLYLSSALLQSLVSLDWNTLTTRKGIRKFPRRLALRIWKIPAPSQGHTLCIKSKKRRHYKKREEMTETVNSSLCWHGDYSVTFRSASCQDSLGQKYFS